jgi:hypothetical protein
VDGFSVSVQVSMDGCAPWWLSAVYGPTADGLKPTFLDELRSLRLALAGLWAIAGDFNLIVDVRDKNNANLNRRTMAMFRRFINELELREANLLGRRYTWSNERDQPTLARLDRWFCSLDWDALYLEASLAAQSSSLSDHCPILMSTSLQVCSKRRFRFEKFWTRLEGFSPTVQASWDRNGSPVDLLERVDVKIRRLARDLQRWSAKWVGSIRD